MILSRTERRILSPRERKAMLIQRPWTDAERRVVWHGFMGRLAIAVEPLICSLVFLALTVGLVVRGRQPEHESAIVLAPIFGLGVIGFTIYAIALIVPPLRAYLHTFSPIYIVDGYVRYRKPDRFSDPLASGYAAVLLEDGSVAAEWPMRGDAEAPDVTRPALVEFSDYGGIHRIDGRSTGVLPERIAPLGVGMAGPPARRGPIDRS
jgi:hypothetical protein